MYLPGLGLGDTVGPHASGLGREDGPGGGKDGMISLGDGLVVGDELLALSTQPSARVLGDELHELGSELEAELKSQLVLLNARGRDVIEDAGGTGA